MSGNKKLFSWYGHIFLRILPPMAALLIKMLMLSCRVVRVEGKDGEVAAMERAGGRVLYGTWHQRMPYHFHYFGSRHVTIMISQSRDGEYAARVAAWLGFRSVRGSSTRGGLGALKGMIKRIRAGETCGVLADGPQGPARIAKMGAIIVAREGGVPLIPVVWGADRCWVFNSWDRYLVPKPFSRVVVYHGEPVRVPKSAKKDEMESYRKLFEDRLYHGTRWCDQQFGEERPWRRTKEAGVPESGPLTGTGDEPDGSGFQDHQ